MLPSPSILYSYVLKHQLIEDYYKIIAALTVGFNVFTQVPGVSDVQATLPADHARKLENHAHARKHDTPQQHLNISCNTYEGH